MGLLWTDIDKTWHFGMNRRRFLKYAIAIEKGKKWVTMLNVILNMMRYFGLKGHVLKINSYLELNSHASLI